MSTKIQKGSRQADQKFRITIADGGPIMVYGKPRLMQKFIVPNERGENWWLQEGLSFEMATEPVALCRCGESKKKPYCDGAHVHVDWDPRLTAPETGVLHGAEVIEGPVLSLSDNQKYCAFARFCDAGLRVWNEVGESDRAEHRDMTVREADHCIAGRLSAWDNTTGEPHEPALEPELGLVEDPKIHASSGLFVSGGIPISRADGFTYEVRNRAMMCRCGQSSNKPWCDGTHASFHWNDGLGGAPTGKKW